MSLFKTKAMSVAHAEALRQSAHNHLDEWIDRKALVIPAFPDQKGFITLGPKLSHAMVDARKAADHLRVEAEIKQEETVLFRGKRYRATDIEKLEEVKS